MNGASVNDLIR